MPIWHYRKFKYANKTFSHCKACKINSRSSQIIRTFVYFCEPLPFILRYYAFDIDRRIIDFSLGTGILCFALPISNQVGEETHLPMRPAG